MKYVVIVMIVLFSLIVREPVFAETSPRSITPPSPEAASGLNKSGSTIPGRPLGTSIAALGAILLLFLGVVQIWKKYTPGHKTELPQAAWELLGNVSLDARHNLMIVRVGSRLIVLGQSEQGLQTLSEITQGEEVAQLIALCHSPDGSTPTSSFDDLLSRFQQRGDELPTSNSQEARSA